MYALDSTICIELMRGKMPAVRETLAHTSPCLVKIPAIVRYELTCGAFKSQNPEKNLLITETFLAPFEVLTFDERCAIEAARIRSDLETRGCKIGPCDLLIAATAIANSATLITDNVREFKRIKHLRLETWADIAWG